MGNVVRVLAEGGWLPFCADVGLDVAAQQGEETCARLGGWQAAGGVTLPRAWTSISVTCSQSVPDQQSPQLQSRPLRI